MSVMRYLAIDPGGKRMGLAVGNDVTRTATPLEVVEPATDELRLRAIARAIDEHGPDALVVGLPLNMDGTAGPAARSARSFGDTLVARFKLPVLYVDERLSSATADEQMARSGLTHGKKKARRDALAAAAILARFLQEPSAPPSPDDPQQATQGPPN
jgi:putative Holliday junction resolvase